jgi:hypothetical protein
MGIKGGIAMVVYTRCLALLFAALLSSVDAAVAQTQADTLRRWGLLGTWAIDCSKPASGSNGYLVYVADAGGKVSHNRDFGDRQDINTVEKTRTGRGEALEVTVNFPGLSQTRKFTMVMGLDGRIRSVANSRADGTEPTIKDGKFTANGHESPWQTRCR